MIKGAREAMPQQLDDKELSVLAFDQADRVRGIGRLSACTLELLGILPPSENQLQSPENLDQMQFDIS